MTDESAFQRTLDDNPDYHDLHRIFADFLEEQGDSRAAGYRWLGENGKRSQWWANHDDWNWWVPGPTKDDNDPEERQTFAVLPKRLWDQIGGNGISVLEGSWKSFPTRRAAEDAFALAFNTVAAAEAELERVRRQLVENRAEANSLSGPVQTRDAELAFVREELRVRERELRLICGEPETAVPA